MLLSPTASNREISAELHSAICAADTLHIEALCGENAIETLLALAQNDIDDDALYDGLRAALQNYGERVIAPALSRGASRDAVLFVAHLFANLGIKDERIFTFLCTVLDVDPACAALMLEEYGDPRASAYIRKAIERYQLDFSKRLSHAGLMDLIRVYLALGGAIDDELAEHLLDLADVRAGIPKRIPPGESLQIAIYRTFG